MVKPGKVTEDLEEEMEEQNNGVIQIALQTSVHRYQNLPHNVQSCMLPPILHPMSMSPI